MTLAVVPARGGSQTLRRKNLLPDATGTPLFLVSARAAAKAGCTVVVSTDDREIGSIAIVNGYDVHWRNSLLANVPVDKVVAAAAKGHTGDILLLQPTVQPIDHIAVTDFLTQAQATGVPAQAAYKDTHLTWHDGRLLTPRVERQQPATWPMRELGIRWWPKQPLRNPVTVIETRALADIDTAADYQSLPSDSIVRLVFLANQRVGSGHLRRCLLLAERLQHHYVEFQPHIGTEQWAINLVKEAGWPIWDSNDLVPDVWVNDTLDTDTSIVADPTYLAAKARLHLEDSGPGRRYADCIINALYDTPNAYIGADWADIRTEFLHTPYTVRETGSQVMLMFGGTDPAGLGERLHGILEAVVDVDWVKPSDSRMVAEAMQHADVLVTSGGRTVFEAAAVGVPTVVLSQNMRETTHTHLGRGNLHLGLGRLVTDGQALSAVLSVLNDYELRKEMSQTGRRSVDGLGVSRIVSMVDWLAKHGTPPTAWKG